MAGSSSFRSGSTLCHNRWPCDFADLIQSCRNRVFTTHRGRDIINQVRAIIATGIPFCGHLGMLPQHMREDGGYKIKGRTETEREALLADARALTDAGAFALVLEIVTPQVAKEISQSIPIPTISIGSGND
jgi:3-methyl-2-oxobutanoate hydroxymethyltransferase